MTERKFERLARQAKRMKAGVSGGHWWILSRELGQANVAAHCTRCALRIPVPAGYLSQRIEPRGETPTELMAKANDIVRRYACKLIKTPCRGHQ